jgi:hypothetical protein
MNHWVAKSPDANWKASSAFVPPFIKILLNRLAVDQEIPQRARQATTQNPASHQKTNQDPSRKQDADDPRRVLAQVIAHVSRYITQPVEKMVTVWIHRQSRDGLWAEIEPDAVKRQARDGRTGVKP